MSRLLYLLLLLGERHELQAVVLVGAASVAVDLVGFRESEFFVERLLLRAVPLDDHFFLDEAVVLVRVGRH